MSLTRLSGASNPAGDLEAELDQLFAMVDLQAESLSIASNSSCTGIHCYTFVAATGLV